MSATQSFSIPRFSGIESEISGTDQERGTLRRADGVNIVPQGAISFGPSWSQAWGQGTLSTAIATALSGATASKVHFVTLTRSGYTFLIAWQYTEARPRGIWQVAGTGDPSLSAASGSSVTATNNTVYRDHTNALPWYGSWIEDELWLGNGTDTNIAWADAALAVLGPATAPTDPHDPSQVAFPPCKSWAMGPDKTVYGAGNVTYPLRIWANEPPRLGFSINRGIKTSNYSYLDLQVNATAITALSIVGETLIAHLDIGPPMMIQNINRSSGGWKCDQRPMEANAGAINPNCTRDTKIAPIYLGSDLEFYSPKQRSAYNKSEWRDKDIVTNRSAGFWNSDATKPISGSDYTTIYDEKNGRFWAWMMMSAGSRQGLYCYEQRVFGITGPFRYPDFLSVCQVRDDNLNGCQTVGITRDGALLWADLAAIGEYTIPTYSTSVPSGCTITASAPTPSAGIPYVAVTADNLTFKQVLNGQTLVMATPWSAFAVSDATCTQYFNNARLAVIEFNEMDFGSPNVNKELIALRTVWRQSSVAYMGAFAEVDGITYGLFNPTIHFPQVNWIDNLRGLGVKVRLRLIIVSFNSQNAVLDSVTLDWQPGVAN